MWSPHPPILQVTLPLPPASTKPQGHLFLSATLQLNRHFSCQVCHALTPTGPFPKCLRQLGPGWATAGSWDSVWWQELELLSAASVSISRKQRQGSNQGTVLRQLCVLHGALQQMPTPVDFFILSHVFVWLINTGSPSPRPLLALQICLSPDSAACLSRAVLGFWAHQRRGAWTFTLQGLCPRGPCSSSP